MRWVEWALEPSHLFFVALLGPLALALAVALVIFVIMRQRRRSGAAKDGTSR